MRRVILFGSLVRGPAGPRSDADLLVVVATSAHREPRDRVPEMRAALRPLPCPADLIVLRSEELQDPEASIGVVREALRSGIDLLGPADAAHEADRA